MKHLHVYGLASVHEYGVESEDGRKYLYSEADGRFAIPYVPTGVDWRFWAHGLGKAAGLGRPFRLSGSTFSATFSDALDLDFSDGHIANCTFTASGNDAIDLSGSTVTIRDVAIDEVGDKAISVGEGSSATASGVQISGAEIALTCKDKSKFEVDACDITTSRIGVTAYQKKPEFGPASITISNLSLSGAEIPYMIEENSTLTLDGKSIPSTYESVKDILYGVEFGKSSK